jgi:hypothetical protein
LTRGVVTGRIDGFYQGTQKLELNARRLASRSEFNAAVPVVSKFVGPRGLLAEIYQLSPALAGDLAALATGRPFSNSTFTAKS